MNRQQLEHAIRAACDVADDDELYVLGSQAILGPHPQAPEALRASVEVDVQPKNRPDAIDFIDGSLGEDSLFHRQHGFYVHGVPVDSALLPEGWESRTIKVSHPRGTRGCTGLCLEAHDLAASKLAAYREKDRDFVSTLLQERLVDPRMLAGRISQLPIPDQHRAMLERWLQITVRGLQLAPDGDASQAPW